MQVVTTHNNTDLDGLASVIAATMLYPGTLPVLPKSVNPNVRDFLSLHKDLFPVYTTHEIDFHAVTRLIVVDANNWNRLDGMKGLDKDKVEILLWDHHLRAGNIAPDWKCQEQMGANITLMVRQLKKERKPLTPIQATLFLCGLYEDTGNLTFPASQPEDAYAAAYLLEFKADLTVLGNFVRPAYSVKQKDILFEMLKKATRTRVDGYKIGFCRTNITGHVPNLSVVVHMYREILNVDAAFGIFTDKEHDKSIVIGRSNIEDINIGVIMQSMGGGGHPAAGSAMIKSARPAAVQEWIYELLRGNQFSTVKIGDLMSYPVVTIPSATPMKEAEALMSRKGFSGLPVVDGETFVGIISKRDFRKVRQLSKRSAPVKAFMSTRLFTIDPGKSPMQAARMMVKHDIGRLPVVEEGRIIGIITRSDTMLYFYDLLPD